MNRRHFLLSVLASPILKSLPKNWKPLPIQEEFYWDKTRIDFIETSLFRVPYHQCNGSTGTWLGLRREN